MKLIYLFLIFIGFSLTSLAQDFSPQYYSPFGQEYVVKFSADYASDFSTLEGVKELSDLQKQQYSEYYIEPALRYLFGPLTHRALGGIHHLVKIEVLWSEAYLKDNRVILPYLYKGVWTLNRQDTLNELNLPVPYNDRTVFTPNWKACTDSHPDHQTESFYWYYWDPARTGCDHREGVEYQTVMISTTDPTIQTKVSFPEYGRMIRKQGGNRHYSMTFAFGYVDDQANPKPDTDRDAGAYEYQKFLNQLPKLLPAGTSVTPITQSEYLGHNGRLMIGRKFSFVKDGVNIVIKVVINAGIDQMKLFAKSYAHDHDGFFAWMGHSRVGSGFDASNFKYMVESNPDYYTISKNYQIIYWGGCNSYSYYTAPFFKMKAAMMGELDPQGTKSLDIVANTLPSYFSFNADNSLIFAKALINWQKPQSYQSLLALVERRAQLMGTRVLAVVLGDEDN